VEEFEQTLFGERVGDQVTVGGVERLDGESDGVEAGHDARWPWERQGEGDVVEDHPREHLDRSHGRLGAVFGLPGDWGGLRVGGECVLRVIISRGGGTYTYFEIGIRGWDRNLLPGRAEGEGFGESDGGAAQRDEAVGVGALGEAKGVLCDVDGHAHSVGLRAEGSCGPPWPGPSATRSGNFLTSYRIIGASGAMGTRG
jgi:hypothetical protein